MGSHLAAPQDSHSQSERKTIAEQKNKRTTIEQLLSVSSTHNCPKKGPPLTVGMRMGNMIASTKRLNEASHRDRCRRLRSTGVSNTPHGPRVRPRLSTTRSILLLLVFLPFQDLEQIMRRKEGESFFFFLFLFLSSHSSLTFQLHTAISI